MKEIKTRDGMKVFGSRLSDNIVIDGNKQLVISNVVIARTGEQEYAGMELSSQLEPTALYVVERNPTDVFNKEFMASFENKPFTDGHPGEDVSPDNHKALAIGFIRNVRPGHLDVKGLDARYYDESGNNVLFAEVVVTDKGSIEYILNELKKELNERKIDVSCGYDAAYIPVDDMENPKRFKQVGSNGNHLALVAKGRAGIAKIRDSIVLEHNNKYFKQTLPYPFEQGLKKMGITNYSLQTMTPLEYFDELVYKAKTHFKEEVQPSNDEQLDQMINYLNNGGVYELPFILYNSIGDNDQDGRHRVEVMRRLGVEDVPVLVFYKTQERMVTQDQMVVTVGDMEFSSDTIETIEELKEVAEVFAAAKNRRETNE